MRQLVYQVCYTRYTRYYVSFYLWQMGSLLNHYKVPKYYGQDCRLLSPECMFRSCLTSCRTTFDLQYWEIKKFQENIWNAWIWWQVPSRPPKKQILSFVLENSKKSVVKHPIEKPVLLNFLNLSTILSPRLPEKTHFHL